MAEIEIKPKAKKPVWPWVLGLLLVIALVVWWVAKEKRSDDQQGSYVSPLKPFVVAKMLWVPGENATFSSPYRMFG